MCKFFIWALLILPHLIARKQVLGVVTLATERESSKDAVSLGIENKRIYCEKQGYDFIYCDEVLDPSRSIPWSKILLKNFTGHGEPRLQMDLLDRCRCPHHEPLNQVRANYQQKIST